MGLGRVAGKLCTSVESRVACEADVRQSYETMAMASPVVISSSWPCFPGVEGLLPSCRLASIPMVAHAHQGQKPGLPFDQSSRDAMSTANPF